MSIFHLGLIIFAIVALSRSKLGLKLILIENARKSTRRCTFKTYKTVDTVETVEPVETLETEKTVETLETAEIVESVETV